MPVRVTAEKARVLDSAVGGCGRGQLFTAPCKAADPNGITALAQRMDFGRNLLIELPLSLIKLRSIGLNL
jgi:hypothetical protein